MTDRSGVLQTVARRASSLERIRGVRVDVGYRGAPFADAMQEKPGAKVQAAKRNVLHAAMPHRWIVERVFGWLEQFRRLWKNTERLPNTSLQFMHLAFLGRLLERL